jgi:flagellar biogenesis protein FliO
MNSLMTSAMSGEMSGDVNSDVHSMAIGETNGEASFGGSANLFAVRFGKNIREQIASTWAKLGKLRRNWRPRTARQLRLCETLPLGERRFLAVVQFEEQKFLIGMAGNSVALLTSLEGSKRETGIMRSETPPGKVSGDEARERGHSRHGRMPQPANQSQKNDRLKRKGRQSVSPKSESPKAEASKNESQKNEIQKTMARKMAAGK